MLTADCSLHVSEKALFCPAGLVPWVGQVGRDCVCSRYLRQLQRLQSRQGTDFRRYVDEIRSSSCVLAVLSLHSLPCAHLLDIMFLIFCPVKSSLPTHFLFMLSTHKPCLVSLPFLSSPSYRIPTFLPCSRDLFPQWPAPCLTHATMFIVLCVAKAIGQEGGIVKVR